MNIFSAKSIEINKAFEDIFSYWSTEAYNTDKKQFYGFIDHFGKKDPNADLGIIMYSRILWAFSAAYIFSKNENYLRVAQETKSFLEQYFQDKKNGGYYWEINSERKPVITKKQIYAQAFVLYAMTEFYAATGDKSALNNAMQIFGLLEKHGLDHKRRGYYEAFAEDWTKLEDVRLSLIDRNDPKSMNTNLHVLEAYTRLLSVTNNTEVKKALTNLCEDFKNHIIDKNFHLQLFFDDNWVSQVNEHSYGHDIETSWLLWDAVETIGDKTMHDIYKPLILAMADTYLNEALDKKRESSLYHKYLDSGKYNTERHWWVMCEALEGLANAYELTHDEKYRAPIIPFWDYIAKHIIDKENGEWHWGVDENCKPLVKEPKICNWKAPYHNGRALMRVIEKMEKWS